MNQSLQRQILQQKGIPQKELAPARGLQRPNYFYLSPRTPLVLHPQDKLPSTDANARVADGGGSPELDEIR